MACSDIFGCFNQWNLCCSKNYSQEEPLLGDQELRSIEEDIKGKVITPSLKIILDRFSYENSTHPLMKKSPEICIKLIPIIMTQVNENLMQRETAKKIVRELARYRVFVNVKIENDINNIIVSCSDGNTNIDKNVLILSNEYFRALFSSNMRENIQNNIDYSNFCSLAVFELLKNFYYEQKIPTIKDNAILAQFFTLVHIIDETVLIESSLKQIKNSIDKICTSKKNLEEAAQLLRHIQEFILDSKEYQLKIAKSYLNGKNIRYIEMENINWLSINISNISVFRNESIVIDILKICVRSISITSSLDIERGLMALLNINVQNACKSFTHLYFNGNNTVLRPEVAQLAQFFPEIAFLIIQTNEVFYEIGGVFGGIPGADGFLRGLSFLNVFNGFKRLVNIDLKFEEGTKFENFVIKYEDFSIIQEIALRVRLRFLFGSTRTYFAVHQDIYRNNMKSLDAVFDAIKQIHWFSYVVKLQKIQYQQNNGYILFQVVSG